MELRHGLSLSLAIVLAFATVAPRVGASSNDAQTAEAMFQGAKEALAQGQIATACARFAESQRLDPAVGTLLNLADCEERLGKLAVALSHFQEAHDELPPDDYRVGFSVERITKLAPRVPRLVLRVRGGSSPSITVLRDATVLGEASMDVALPVDPGMHVCVVRAPGHADSRQEITIREGETQTYDLDLGPLDRKKEGPVVGAVVVDGHPGRGQRVVGLVAGGVGLAAIGVGSVFGLVARSTYESASSHCPTGPLSCDAQGPIGSHNAYTQARIADIAFVAGGVLVAGGLVVFLTAPAHATPPHSASTTRSTTRAQVTVAPVVGPREGGFGVRGTW